MIKERIQLITESVLKAYVILMVFIIPQNQTGLIMWASILIPLCLYWLYILIKNGQIKINKKYFMIWTLLIVVVIFDVLLSEYSTSKLLQNTLQLFVLALIASEKKETNPKTRIDVFYIIMTVFLIYNIILTYKSNTVLRFTNFADTNYASVIVFLYFLYSIKKGYKSGIIIALVYLLINFSRLYIIGLIAFIIFAVISKTPIIKKAEDKEFSTKTVFGIFCTMIAFTYALSYFWMGVVVGSSTTKYKASLNDTSNAIRMNANIYSIKVIKNDMNLLWRGYDSDIKSALGLDDDLIENHKTYSGFRIVQPHNSYINPFLTYGILYTVMYLMVLSFIFAKLISYKNIKIWGPYFIMCLFMHSLLTTFFLVFFVLVLKSDTKDKKKENHVKIQEET